jgi:hypothetical protein
MTASAKFQAIILSLTTAIIILIWKEFGNQIGFPLIVLFLSGGLISIATYKLLYSFLIFIFGRSRLFRMFLLHKLYLEGTWVGFYIGIGGKVRFIKEEFKQDLNGLIIKGTGFNENKQMHATWISDTTKIDDRLGKLIYMYEVYPVNENMTGYGVANFDLKEFNFLGISQRITGYTSDNHWGKRLKSIEVKISNRHNISDKDALVIAEKIYNENINNY